MDEVLRLEDVSVTRGDATLLTGIDWAVGAGERWVVLGPNGSGKTTLLRVASLYLHPSQGRLFVLGEELGHTDVRLLRGRVGLASQAFADLLRPDLAVADVVMTAKNGALEPWWHTYDPPDRERARLMLDRLGLAPFAERRFGTLSSGERQRAQLARTLMTEPELLLLDEPTAGLDLGGREDLVSRLSELANDPATPPTVLVTHHVEEVPDGFTHALLLGAGRIRHAGPIHDVLTSERLSECFGLDLELTVSGGRWSARRVV